MPPPVAAELADEGDTIVYVLPVVYVIWNSPFKVSPPTAEALEKVTKSPFLYSPLASVTVTIVGLPEDVANGLVSVTVARIGVIS